MDQSQTPSYMYPYEESVANSDEDDLSESENAASEKADSERAAVMKDWLRENLLKRNLQKTSKGKSGRKRGTKSKSPSITAATEEGECSDEGATQSQAKAIKKKKISDTKYRWSHEQITELIYLLEQSICLWDLSSKTYHLRDERERTLQLMAEKLKMSTIEVKAKIASLRAQLGREQAKARKTKSGQGTDQLHQPTWLYWQNLQFLVPVMQAGKRRDTIASPEAITIEDENLVDDMQNTTPKTRRASNKSDKQALLKECISALKQPQEVSTPCEKNTSHFALYIDEKLAAFEGRTRTIAEKRISDVIFDIEINGVPPTAPPSMPSSSRYHPPATPYDIHGEVHHQQEHLHGRPEGSTATSYLNVLQQ